MEMGDVGRGMESRVGDSDDRGDVGETSNIIEIV